MKIRELIDRFFFARVFWDIDIRVRFHSGEENYKGTKELLKDCGETVANKVEFGESGLIFYVSENDEDW